MHPRRIDGPFEKIEGFAKPAFTREDCCTGGLFPEPRDHDLFVAINRLLAAGDDVYG
jgi:hypothetical protein